METGLGCLARWGFLEAKHHQLKQTTPVYDFENIITREELHNIVHTKN